MLNGLGFELPLMTSFPETLNGSRMEVFFIARKVKLCESPSKAGGLPILIIDRKRHVAVDSDGRLLLVNLTPANIADSVGAQAVLEGMKKLGS